MALVADQIKGYSALTVRPQPGSRGVSLRCFVPFQLVERTEKLASLRRHLHFRRRPIILPKEKPFRVSSFKSSGQHGEANGTDRKSQISKKTAHLSYEWQEREETLAASSDVTSSELSYASENRDVTVPGPQAVQKLFKKWLIMLRSEALIEAASETYIESPVHGEISENREIVIGQKAENVLKATFLLFMGLDAAIKIPLLIFLPCYSITRVVYGVQVTRGLAPLWILGPLIAAVYIKLIQGLCSLYIFGFKQSIRFSEKLPMYYMLSYSYVSEGKFQTFLHTLFCEPIVDLKNMDYKALVRDKWKQAEEWASEKYVDYVESVWPYYCRTIRVLKKANLL